MDFRWLTDLSTEFEGFGIAPTKLELVAMKSSVSLLCERAHHDLVHFWGKVKGTERNYLIIVCYTGGLMGTRTPYASLDGVSWFGLPKVTEKLIYDVANIRTAIKGQPLEKIPVRHPRNTEPYKDLKPLLPPKPEKGEEEEEEKPEEEEEQKEEEPENEEEPEPEEEEEDLPEYIEAQIGEDQRLAVLVHIIDKRGLIFPQDSLLWKSTFELKPNPLFKGAPLNSKLDDFCRLDPEVMSDTQRPNAIVDAMPKLTSELPPNGWFVSTTTHSNVVKVCSRVWPGLVFICKGNKWGTVYFGDAKPNTDYLFAVEGLPREKIEIKTPRYYRE